MTGESLPAAMWSESASDAMGAYLVDGVDSVGGWTAMTPHEAALVAAYIQGAAAIHAAELTAAALDRLAAAITPAAIPARGTV
jgi:hypothetical protein